MSYPIPSKIPPNVVQPIPNILGGIVNYPNAPNCPPMPRNGKASPHWD